MLHRNCGYGGGCCGPSVGFNDASGRAALLDRVIADTLAVADSWAAAAAAKGFPGDAGRAEELYVRPGLTIRLARLLRSSMRDVERVGRPQLPGRIASGADGRVRARVLPTSVYDSLVYSRAKADMWFCREAGVDSVLAGQAWAYQPGRRARVTAVLAASNVASLGPRDALHELVVQGNVVVLKANPINDYLAVLGAVPPIVD